MLTMTTLRNQSVMSDGPEDTMSRSTFGTRTIAAWLWTADRPLAAVTGLMLVALVASALAILVDPRTIAGAPAWLKPAKFAASTAIYAATLAWAFTHLP